MISLALISGLVVVASSAVAGHVGDVPGVASVGRVRSMGGQVGKTSVKVDGVDPGVLEGPVVTKVEAGSIAGLRSGQAVLPRNLAKTLKVSVGSSAGLTTASGTQYVAMTDGP